MWSLSPYSQRIVICNCNFFPANLIFVVKPIAWPTSGAKLNLTNLKIFFGDKHSNLFMPTIYIIDTCKINHGIQAGSQAQGLVASKELGVGLFHKSRPEGRVIKLFSSLPSGWTCKAAFPLARSRNTQGGSITVLLTSCLTSLDLSVLQLKTKIVSCHAADSKRVKQEVNSIVILLPL